MRFIIFIFIFIESLFSYTFFSTQMAPSDEKSVFEDKIISKFSTVINFQTNDLKKNILLLSKSEEFKNNILYAGIVSDFKLLDKLNIINHITPQEVSKYKGIQEVYLNQAKIKDNYYFVPWLQATYIMVANKKALKFLPKNANLDSLSYDEFINWNKNIYENTKQKKLVFPMGEQGLFNNYIEANIYPSYVENIFKDFNSNEAIKMWENQKELWNYVNPISLSTSFTSEALIKEDAWIAWDHTARLKAALDKNPENFIVFKLPIGPKGRGVKSVLVGLAFPKNKLEISDSFFEYLMDAKTQTEILKNIGFLPIEGKNDYISSLNSGLKSLNLAVENQMKDKNSIIKFNVMNLDSDDNLYKYILKNTFSQIVLRNKNIKEVLNTNQNKLINLLKKNQAVCWDNTSNKFDFCIVE